MGDELSMSRDWIRRAGRASGTRAFAACGAGPGRAGPHRRGVRRHANTSGRVFHRHFHSPLKTDSITGVPNPKDILTAAEPGKVFKDKDDLVAAVINKCI